MGATFTVKTLEAEQCLDITSQVESIVEVAT